MRTDTTEEISVAKESNDVGEKENVLNYAIGTESVQGNVTNSHPNTINETTEAHVEQDQREHLNEGKELPLEEKNDSEGHTHNSIVSRLTVDQLLDYVKKQNAKVKKLKMENDEFRSQLEIRSPELHSGQGFWRDIHNRPVWQKQLAQGVLHYFLQSISRPRSSLSQLRQAFLHWCRLSAEIKSAELVTKVMEASETQAQLEQRVVKLKTLLAKMHQSNQKNVEDTVLARKNQLEIALEYQQRMTQEEAEKQALEEQLRCLAFESALHSDMEFVIEKAAQQIAAKNAGNATEASQSLKFYELQQHVSTIEKELFEAKSLIQSYEAKILQQSERLLSLERQLERSKESEERLKCQISQLQNQSTDLEIAKQDLEVELKILLNNRTNVAAEIEARSSAKASQLLKSVESTLAETQAALESWEKRALISESREERQNREISILRKQVADLQTVQLENENLVKIVREMKKSLGGSGPSPHPQIGHSMSGEAEKEVSKGDRNLLKKIQQESMLIVDRDTFQYILRQSETHERSLLSASQHLTVFDSDLKLQKRRSLFLQNILSNYQLVGREQNLLFGKIIDMLTLRTLRYLDTLLGFDHFSILGLSCSQHLDLQDCTSERCRSQYNSIFQNIDMLDDLLQHEDSHTQEELIETTSALPSFLDHPVVVDASSFTISERYQQAFAALKTNSNNRNLAVVYQRILKKMKKTEAQLLEHVASMESAKSRVEASLTEISGHIDQKLSRDSVESSGMTTAALALPVVTIHPHHLKWEAIDIKIPAGGVVTLPIPTPILPVTAPSDSQLLILSKQLSVSWAVRSSSSSYIQVSISSPSKDSQSLRFDRLRSEPISPAEVSQRGIQFGYVRSHEDVLSRLGETIVCGQHIIQTSDGNRLLEISNRAVWATITLSYQIEIDNYIAEPMPPRPIMTPKPTRDDPEHLSKLHQLQSVLAQEQERVDSLQHKIDTLQNRLRSMSGPLLLLRETFKAGLFLREKFCSQWEHFHAVESVYRQHLDNHFHLNEPQESIIPTAFDQQSVWLQDIDLIKRAIEEHDDSQPLLLTHLFPPSSPTSAIHVPETEVCSPPESATPTSPRSPQPFAPKDFSAPERILLSSSNLKIRPSSDFRCPIKIPRTTVSSTLYTLSWDFTLLSLSGEELPSQSPDNIDIGFCVLGKSADGSFPLLTPYKRIGPVGTNIVGSLTFFSAGNDSDGDGDGDIAPAGLETNEGDVLRIPYPEVILLFDNTYSWFKPKFIRYEISLDFNSNENPSSSLAQECPQFIDNEPILLQDSHHPQEVILNSTQSPPEDSIDLNYNPSSTSFPQEILSEVTSSCAKILQISDEIHEFVNAVTSLTYK